MKETGFNGSLAGNPINIEMLTQLIFEVGQLTVL